MTQPPLEDDSIQKLAVSYATLNQDKMHDRIGRLHQMAVFYSSKMPEAPDRQKDLFNEFIGSLNYAMTVIKMHDVLTHRLAELTNTNEEPTT